MQSSLQVSLFCLPVYRRNLPDHATDDYLARCRYDPNHATDKRCPIFTLGSIVSGAGYSYENLTEEVHWKP